MARAATKLRFFLDNNVPDSIGRYLQRRGHSVRRLRHHIPTDSPDPVVAMTALASDRILVTIDKDFNSQRFQQPRFATLSRISLSGSAHTLLAAIKRHLHVIEYQWDHLRATKAPRMVVYLREDQFRFRD